MRLLSTFTILALTICSVSAQAQTVIYSTPVAMPICYDTTMAVHSTSAPATHTAYCGLFARQRPVYAAQQAYYPQTMALQPQAGAAASDVGFYGNPCGCGPTANTFLPPPVTVGVPTAGFQAPVVLGQSPSNHYIGRGIVGQPKLYVSGQPIRNALRFITP